jgi:Multiubiquitin
MEPVQEVCEERERREHHTITVFVNEHPVKFHQHEATGAQIKAAAIAQGVKIQSDFTLFEKREHHPLKQIGDQEKVTLHEHEKFRAVAPDDNSQEEL